MNMRPTKFGVGQSVKRVEDIRFISGQGKYATDAVEKSELKAVFLRSPYGHAKFSFDDLEAARAAPGVRAVYVASDFAELGDLPCLATVDNADGSSTPLKPYPVMASDEAHHVGDIIAMVVADTTVQARDAAELISVTWEDLPAVIENGRGRAAGSPARLRRRARQRRLRHSHRQTRTRQIKRLRARRTRFASKSSTRAWSPTIWSRGRPLANMTRSRAGSCSTRGARASTSCKGSSPKSSTSRARTCASSPRTSAAASAPRTCSIANIRSFSRRRGDLDVLSAGSPTAASISSATFRGATM